MRVRGWLKQQLADEIVVHTVEGHTIRGFLEAVGNDGIVLRAAQFHDTEAKVDLAGETFIPRAKISFAQIRPTAY